MRGILADTADIDVFADHDGSRLLGETRMAPPLAFLPLVTYPEPVSDPAVAAALALSRAIKCGLSVVTYSVSIPQVGTPLGGMLLDLPALARAAEDKSRADAAHLHDVVVAHAGPGRPVSFTARDVPLGAVLDCAVADARLADLVVVPWSADTVAHHDVMQTLVFEAGRPVILVPALAAPAGIDHLAIAWDGSRVAARALGDALPLLADGGAITVLTVGDEKPLAGADPAGTLASALQKRGYQASAQSVALGGLTIAGALQEAARAAGAQMMAMGGFGHSRLRDFILGGATTGILSDLKLPTLLSH